MASLLWCITTKINPDFCAENRWASRALLITYVLNPMLPVWEMQQYSPDLYRDQNLWKVAGAAFPQWVVPTNAGGGLGVAPCLWSILNPPAPEVKWRFPPSLSVLAWGLQESQWCTWSLLAPKAETSGEGRHGLLAQIGSRKPCDRLF